MGAIVAKQNREAPAYQEYAAAMLANVNFRTMTLAERGLLYTLRLEFWVNKSLPSNPDKLAKLIGFDRADVVAALPSVLPFIQDKGGDFTCPELDNYRAYLDEIRDKQSQGGKDGAAKTNKKRRNQSSGDSSPNLSGDSSGDLRVLSTAQHSTEQHNQNQSFSDGAIDDDFVIAYNRASNGD